MADEKIELLMEETGCDQAEAELAFELADNDFAKAIKKIKSLLRDIVVLKGKFVIEEKHIYGVFVIIFDRRKENVIRIVSVASYNPVIYEALIDTDWHLLEKSIYTYRLLDGSILSVTREIEEHFYKQISGSKEKLYKIINRWHEYHSDDEIEKAKEIFLQEFPVGNSKLQIMAEDINLAEYQQGAVEESFVVNNDKYPKKVLLEVKLCEHEEGKKAISLTRGEVILVEIIDDREIAKYIVRLLGTRESAYIPVTIEDLNRSDDELNILVYFTPSITGFAKIKPSARVRAVKEIQQSWWRKIFHI